MENIHDNSATVESAIDRFVKRLDVQKGDYKPFASNIKELNYTRIWRILSCKQKPTVSEIQILADQKDIPQNEIDEFITNIHPGFDRRLLRTEKSKLFTKAFEEKLSSPEYSPIMTRCFDSGVSEEEIIHDFGLHGITLADNLLKDGLVHKEGNLYKVKDGIYTSNSYQTAKDLIGIYSDFLKPEDIGKRGGLNFMAFMFWEKPLSKLRWLNRFFKITSKIINLKMEDEEVPQGVKTELMTLLNVDTMYLHQHGDSEKVKFFATIGSDTLAAPNRSSVDSSDIGDLQ